MRLSPCLVRAQCVGGVIPRRAVILGDLLGERTRREEEEVEAVSQLCELLKAAAGEAVYPRDAEQLIEMCLERNGPDGWVVLARDIDLLAAGEVRAGARSYFERHPTRASAFVRCLLGAHDVSHVTAIAHCIVALAPCLPGAASSALGTAVADQLAALAAVLASHCRALPTSRRQGVFGVLGRVVAASREGSGPGPVIDAAYARTVGSSDDLLRMFLCIPLSESVLTAPDGVTALVARGRRIPPAARYPVLATLARAVSAGLSSRADVEALALHTLSRTTGDPKICVMCATILASSAQSADLRTVAKALMVACNK